MAATVRRSFELPLDQAELIDRKVARGEFASADAVVQAGLHTLSEHEADVDAWLRDEVVPTAEKMKLEPERGIAADVVFADLRKRYASE